MAGEARKQYFSNARLNGAFALASGAVFTVATGPVAGLALGVGLVQTFLAAKNTVQGYSEPRESPAAPQARPGGGEGNGGLKPPEPPAPR